MSNQSDFNWKYLIPGYGIYLINKSDIEGKRKFIFINVCLIILVLGILGSFDDKSVNTATNTNKANGFNKNIETKIIPKIGDLIKTKKFEIKVSSVTNRSSVGSEYLSEKAAEGAIFAVVNFNYKNITREPISSFSVPELKIIDPNGTKYDEAAGATAYYQTEINLNKKAISDLNPGITQNDAIVFEVSRDLWKSKGWKLIIDADDDIEVQIK